MDSLYLYISQQSRNKETSPVDCLSKNKQLGLVNPSSVFIDMIILWPVLYLVFSPLVVTDDLSSYYCNYFYSICVDHKTAISSSSVLVSISDKIELYGFLLFQREILYTIICVVTHIIKFTEIDGEFITTLCSCIGQGFFHLLFKTTTSFINTSKIYTIIGWFVFTMVPWIVFHVNS